MIVDMKRDWKAVWNTHIDCASDTILRLRRDTMRSGSKVLLVLLLMPLAITLTVGVLPAASEGMSARDVELLRAKVRADKKLFISQNMGLMQSEAVGFWPVYDRYQKELEGLANRTIALIEDYARSYDTMTNATAKDLLDRYLAIQADRLKVRRAYLPEFRRVLSDRQVARYYQLENKIRAVTMFQLAAKIPFI